MAHIFFYNLFSSHYILYYTRLLYQNQMSCLVSDFVRQDICTINTYLYKCNVCVYNINRRGRSNTSRLQVDFSCIFNQLSNIICSITSFPSSQVYIHILVNTYVYIQSVRVCKRNDVIYCGKVYLMLFRCDSDRVSNPNKSVQQVSFCHSEFLVICGVRIMYGMCLGIVFMILLIFVRFSLRNILFVEKKEIYLWSLNLISISV